MKKKIGKWTFRLAATGLLLFGILAGIVLNPSILYAFKTSIGNYNVYHNLPLDKDLRSCLEASTQLLRSSELYDSNLNLDICLNDGSYYPGLIEILGGKAFARGFYDKVVLMGSVNSGDNTVKINGYEWNLTQLLAHEETHCLQYNKYGFWKSNPVAKYPDWKWEGYPEYIARRNTDQTDLAKNIERKIEADMSDKGGWAVYFSDSTIAPKEYYNSWLLIQYFLDIKKMSYGDLLNDVTSEPAATEEMMSWYSKQKNH